MDVLFFNIENVLLSDSLTTKPPTKGTSTTINDYNTNHCTFYDDFLGFIETFNTQGNCFQLRKIYEYHKMPSNTGQIKGCDLPKSTITSTEALQLRKIFLSFQHKPILFKVNLVAA